MRTSLSLQQLAQEVDRQAQAKRDLIVPTRALQIVGHKPESGPNRFRMSTKNGDWHQVAEDMTDNAHGQMGEYLGIPKPYYDRLRVEYPHLLDTNVNSLLYAYGEKKERRMVRLLDGRARAILSPSYRPLDNIQLLEALLPTLEARPDLKVASLDITEHRMYLKFVSDELSGEVKPGDVIRMGFIASNSEVGRGAIQVAPFTERLACYNGAVHLRLGQRKAHLGRAFDSDSDAPAEWISDETRQADDRRLFLAMRDVVKALVTGDTLNALLNDMRQAAEQRVVDGDIGIEEVVDVTAVRLSMTQPERSKLLTHLIEGGDLTRYGLAQAVTRTANDQSIDYDRATELEIAGGEIMSSPVAFTPGDVSKARSVRRRQLVPA